jgi:hypothetical protein
MYMFMVAVCLFLLYNSGLLESNSAASPTAATTKPEESPFNNPLVNEFAKDSDDVIIRNPKWRGQKSPHSFNSNRVSFCQ